MPTLTAAPLVHGCTPQTIQRELAAGSRVFLAEPGRPRARVLAAFHTGDLSHDDCLGGHEPWEHDPRGRFVAALEDGTWLGGLRAYRVEIERAA